MNGGERIDPKKNSTPNVNYNLVQEGRGTGSLLQKPVGGMHGLQDKGISGGPQEEYKDRNIGTKRYDLVDRSVNGGRRM